jgi:hypothetical protein
LPKLGFAEHACEQAVCALHGAQQAFKSAQAACRWRAGLSVGMVLPNAFAKRRACSADSSSAFCSFRSVGIKRGFVFAV